MMAMKAAVPARGLAAACPRPLPFGLPGGGTSPPFCRLFQPLRAIQRSRSWVIATNSNTLRTFSTSLTVNWCSP